MKKTQTRNQTKITGCMARMAYLAAEVLHSPFPRFKILHLSVSVWEYCIVSPLFGYEYYMIHSDALLWITSVKRLKDIIHSRIW